MSNQLSIDQVRAHPGLANVIEFQTPTRKGNAPVAGNRLGTPITIAYEIHGKGPIHLVWVMGLKTPKIAWHRQTKYFGHERSDTYTSLVFDNRGVGASEKPLARYTTSEMAKDLLDLVDYLGWTEKKQLHIIGVSMGGMIAQEFAYLAPERIASLCLQSTAARLTITPPWHVHLVQRAYLMFPKTLAAQIALGKSSLFSEAWLEAPDEMGVFPTNGDRYAAEELWRINELHVPLLQGFILQGLAAISHYMGPERLAVIGEKIRNIMVCTGSEDRMIEHIHSDVLVKEIRGAVKKRVFEGCGHAIHFENVVEFNQFIEEFVTEAHKREH